jgi:hypothetical protein
MTEVSTYALDQRIRILEDRIKAIEKARLDEMKRKLEQEHRKTERLMRGMTFGFVLVAAVAWAVMLTLIATGHTR